MELPIAVLMMIAGAGVLMGQNLQMKKFHIDAILRRTRVLNAIMSSY